MTARDRGLRLLRRRSAGDELVVAQPLLAVEHHERAVQHALAVFAARIDAHGSPDLRHSTRFVDVAVERDEWLVALDQLAYGLRAGGGHGYPAAPDDGLERGVELRGLVKRSPSRRDVQVEDAAAGLLQLGYELFEMRGQLILGHLARRVPWRGVRDTAREHLDVLAELHWDV